MRLVTIEDVKDIYVKLSQRGLGFILSKLNLNSLNRTRSSFNKLNIDSSNWWVIPKIRERWNFLITGNSNCCYEAYISNTIFKNTQHFKLLSVGSGISSHELVLAELNPSWNILCIDISNKLLDKAKQKAVEKKLTNIQFLNYNIYEFKQGNNAFDGIMFHSSLHHFKNIENFIFEKVVKKLKPEGKLIINEYVGVNRLQYNKDQLFAINKCIKVIDKKYRKIYKTNLYKNKFYGNGLIRMIVADPSECIDSASILPSIYKYFHVIEEKPFGGNLLMSALKDVAHHFIKLDSEKELILDKIIEHEDKYLENNKSDFVFGVYQLK